MGALLLAPESSLFEEEVDFLSCLLQSRREIAHELVVAENLVVAHQHDFAMPHRPNDLRCIVLQNLGGLRIANGGEMLLARHIEQHNENLILEEGVGAALKGANGEQLGDFHGHAWNCVVVLRFYFFSLPSTVAVFSFNFFAIASYMKKRGSTPLFLLFLCIVLFGRVCAVCVNTKWCANTKWCMNTKWCVNTKWCARGVSPAVACSPARAIGGATDEDVRAIPVHERHLGRRLDEDIDFATRLLEKLLDFRHRAIVTELIAVGGKVDEGVINTSDVSREEGNGAAELRVRDGDEVCLTRHEDALDEDFASLELVGLGGESADGEPGEESGEWARGDTLRRGHAWIAWWYFDSTSFPYPSLWRFSLSIFSMRKVH